MSLRGESASNTVIRLRDHASGFGDAGAPRGMIMTTAKLLDGSPTSGGKDYTHKGEGNDAYENFVEDLTIDAGAGNPGAIGIDYLANNIGAVRNVTVRAADGSGAIGIAMQRKWIGPALLQHVTVHGFATGIAVANTEYGITLDHVALAGQQRIGLENASNAVSAADLTIDTPGEALANTAPGGLVVLAHSRLSGKTADGGPLTNHGAVLADDVRVSPNNAVLHGVFQGGDFRALPLPPLSLPDAPAPPNDPPASWVSVMRFATPSAGEPDITEALRRAMASGASTIYLPYGRYTITDGLSVPPTVRRIVGFNASITVKPERNPAFARDTGMFRVDQPGPALTIERVVFDMTNLGDQLAVQQTAERDLVFVTSSPPGTSLLQRGPGGGRAFIEDVCCNVHITGVAPVYARQLDTEGGGRRIVNDGSPLVVLGIETEGDCTVIENHQGAHSTILGGLLSSVHDANPGVPAFRNAGAARSRASFIEAIIQRGQPIPFLSRRCRRASRGSG